MSKEETKNQEAGEVAEQSFIKRARAEAKSSEINDFGEGVEIFGEYLGTEIIQVPDTQSDEEDAVKDSPVITLRTGGEKKRFWGFGLLMHNLEKFKVQAGWSVYIKKTPKRQNKKGSFWGCEFFAEKPAEKK